MVTRRVKVGEGHGGTYWYDVNDLYVYRRDPEGKWLGWLCRSEYWDNFRASMKWSVPVASAMDPTARELDVADVVTKDPG